MTPQTIPDRLPCPFCGSNNISDGEVLSARDNGDTFKQSACLDCGAVGPEAQVDGPDYGDVAAIAAWNKRAAAALSGREAVEFQYRRGELSEWQWCSREEYEARRLECPHLRHEANEWRALYTTPQPGDGWRPIAEAPTWTRERPTSRGVYGVRGFELGIPAKDQFEAVVLVREVDGELVCNLHESTSDRDVGDWPRVADTSDRFEWCRFEYAAAPSAKGVAK